MWGIAGARTGSSAAEDQRQRLHVLDERFEELRPRLVGICRSVAGDVAEDAVHDAYLYARRSIDQLRDLEALDAWLTTIALRQCITGHRRARRLRDRLADLLPRASSGMPDLGLRELVERLPMRARAVLVLHHGYGYSLAEVADILGLTHTNVRSIAARSRRRLLEQAREADGA
ncbi:MAG TPA: RNA polymerase sigma factor [Candidatus Limnocylindria bacterium]|nr:RNA polymerase sigma factor [Candidatus Limnocylindria bacterium]